MRKLICIALISLCLAVSVHAQTPVSYKLEVWTAGSNVDTGLPIKSIDFVPTQITCNQVPQPVPAQVFNPTKFYFDDVNNPGKVCGANFPSTYLDNIPNGSGYFNTLTYATAEALVAPRSAASNFFTRMILNVLTGLKVIR